MVETFQEIAGSGSLAAAIPVAVLAGLISFFSPCVLPLLPGYISYATGLSAADLAENKGKGRRGRMVLGSTLFVLGFSAVFVLAGSLFGAVGMWLLEWRQVITIVMGVLVIVLGLAFAGWLPIFQRDVRVHKVPAVGLGAAPLLGFLFGLGWTPCIGPTLGVILSLGLYEATAARGALLAFAYCIGLGAPFILVGFAYERMLNAFSFFRRHQLTLMRIGGVMMILVGLALVTGAWDHFITQIQRNLISGFEVGV